MLFYYLAIFGIIYEIWGICAPQHLNDTWTSMVDLSIKNHNFKQLTLKIVYLVYTLWAFWGIGSKPECILFILLVALPFLFPQDPKKYDKKMRRYDALCSMILILFILANSLGFLPIYIHYFQIISQ